MRKKLVIFDLDGTLLDTSHDLMDSMNGMLKYYGYPLISLQQTKQYIGDGARNFVLRSLPENGKEFIDDALKRYNEIYNASGSPKTRLYDGMEAVLQELKERGVLIAIASNKPQTSTDEIYKKYLSGYAFDFIYGKRDGFDHKPSKECGEYILKTLNVTKDNCVIVGDGDADVVFAKNLGCPIISVTWGYRNKEQLFCAGGDAFVDSPTSLIEEINNYLGD